jgi:hypothetical protein
MLRRSSEDVKDDLRRISLTQIAVPPLIFVIGLAVCFVASLIERWWAGTMIYVVWLLVLECLVFMARAARLMLCYAAARKSCLLWVVCLYTLAVLVILGIIVH